MLRVVSTFCLCAIALLLLNACSGSGRAIVTSSIGTFDYAFDHGPAGLEGTPCGVVELEGRLFVVHCDPDGEPIYLVPIERPNRRSPLLRDPDPDQLPPLHGIIFPIDGATFATMSLPDDLLDVDPVGAAESLLLQHGVVSEGNVHEVPFWYQHDAVTGQLDVQVAMSSAMPLPDPFLYDLQHETIVVPSTTQGPAFVLHRVVGAADEIAAYLRAAGLSAVAPRPSLAADPAGDVEVGGTPW
jgi:hypothetical protein